MGRCSKRDASRTRQLAVLERYQRYLHYYRKKDGAALSIASRRAKIVLAAQFWRLTRRTNSRQSCR